ncbi:MAG: 50S ribosomal protein L11 methyltransferase [Pseudomonadota bacterium]
MHKVVWTGPRAAMEAAADYISEFIDGDHPVGIEKINPAAEDTAPQAWKAEAYFETPPDIAALEAAFAAFADAWRDIAPGEIEELPDIDWVAHALEGLGVVRAGRFILYGVHDADKLPDEDGLVPIRIDANQAFGTGHHPTTAGCLQLLDRFAGLAPKKALDLGCGSAVLAIAAAKVWKRMVLATDIDATSVEIAAENVALNDVDDFVVTETADGFDSAGIKEAAPFDFVFANILAGPLKEFAPAMANHVSRNGRVMLAGLMAEQEAGVIEAYEAAGFRMINRLEHQTWPVLLFVST